ncbi:MAG TPA: histidine kinase [Streptosporangiaceae bacterium]|nr:histidine kinase [Streptosporangiaceae bacterium]
MRDVVSSDLGEKIPEVMGRERCRLARELHDHVGSGLSVAVRRLELHDAFRQIDPERADAHLLAARQELLRLLGSISDLITDLRDTPRSISLAREIGAFATSRDGPHEDGQPAVHVHIAGDESCLPVPVRYEFYLIVRECLRNVFRHAWASHVAIDVRVAAGTVRAVIKDDGIGFDCAEVIRQGRADGLLSMKERLEILHGGWDLRSVPSLGTRVEVWVPVPSDRHRDAA